MGRNVSFYIEHEVTGVDITFHVFSHSVMVSTEGAGEFYRHLGVIAVFKSFFGRLAWRHFVVQLSWVGRVGIFEIPSCLTSCN